MGKLREGLADFRLVVKIAPRDPDARKKLRECEAALKKLRFEEAIRSSASDDNGTYGYGAYDDDDEAGGKEKYLAVKEVDLDAYPVEDSYNGKEKQSAIAEDRARDEWMDGWIDRPTDRPRIQAPASTPTPASPSPLSSPCLRGSRTSVCCTPGT